MSNSPLGEAVWHLGRAALAGGGDPRPDGELVARFVAARDEPAFAELLRRHGPTVLGVCRRVLADRHDADDAFQAVWLVFARKAGSVRPPGLVGNWLYGVAVRTATKAKGMAAKRRQRELASGPLLASGRVQPGRPDPDLRPAIDEELARLPDKLRAPVVLCDLGGKSRSEAAAELGWPEGTVAARLAKARDLLAARLRKRGVTLSAAGSGVVAVPADLSAGVLGAVFGGPAASPAVCQLAEGVMRSMSVGTWKLGAAAVLTAGLAVGAAVAVAGPSGEKAVPQKVAAPAATPADPPPEKERNQDLWVWREQARPGLSGGRYHSVAFSPDGKRLAVGGDNGDGITVEVWDAAGRARVWRGGVFPAGFTAIAYSPDGKRLVATRDKVTGFFDAADGQTVFMDPPFPGGRAVAFSPDGKRVAVSDGQSLVVRNVGSPGEARFGPFGHPADAPKFDGPPPAAVAFSPDGKRVLFLPNVKIDPTWPENGAKQADPTKATHWYTQIWGAGSGDVHWMELLKQGTAPVAAAVWSADGKRIATGDAEGTVVIWDGERFKELKRLKLSGPVTALAFRADSRRFAAGVRAEPAKPGDGSAVRVEVWTVWEGSTPDNWLSSSTLTLPAGAVVRSLAFAPDGLTLVAGTDGGLRVWDRVKLAPK